jgi:hypothetical protein
MTKATNTNHYINNADFLAALLDHREKVQKARTDNTDMPPVSNYLGDCFIKIARHLSYKSNFINYSYKDEMISDAIENCLAVVNNFDPAKSKNPFAYFTQITFFAFVRRIQKEKKQQATKYKLLENIDIDMLIAHSDGNEEFANSIVEMMRKQVDNIDIDKRTVKKPKKKAVSDEGTLDIE